MRARLTLLGTAINNIARCVFFGAIACIGITAGAQAATAQESEVPAYHVGVWYFTLWNSVTRSFQVQQAQKIYGRTDVWAGVRDYAEGHGATPIIDPNLRRSVDFHARVPLLGFYDEMSPAVIDTQIRQAASEGIEYFAFYYYFNVATGDETDLSAPIPKFFESPTRHLIKYILAPIAIGSKGEKLSLDVWRKVVVPKLVGYLGSDAYFKINGRPVLIDFKTPFSSGEEKRAAYDELRRASAARFGVEPIILNLLDARARYEDLAYRKKKANPDGFICFNNYEIKNPYEPYQDLVDNWFNSMEKQIAPSLGSPDPHLIYVPCGSVGQDPRPWYGIGWTGWQGKRGPESRPFTIGVTPDAFAHHLRDLKSFIDSGKVNTLNMAVLYAWNEWGEAAATIEPSKAFQYQYAETVKNVFGLVPRCPRPPLLQQP